MMYYIESPSTDPHFNLALEQYVFDGLDPEQDYAVTGTEEHDFLYEQVGDQWIFTTFSAVR